MSLAEDSESANVTTDITDVQDGTDESNYAGKDVRGKLILASSQADAVAAIGVAKHGAAGIVSYAQNQHTGWWGENTDLVRWGHLDTFAKVKTFAFMSFVPSRKIGVAVFANNDGMGGALTQISTALVYQLLTNGQMKSPFPIDQVGPMLGQERERMKADLERRAARPQNLPFPLDAYAGVYTNPAMGTLRLEAVNGKLEAHLGAAWSAIEVFDNTQNKLRIALFGNGEVVSVEMKDGKAVTLSFGGNDYKRVN